MLPIEWKAGFMDVLREMQSGNGYAFKCRFFIRTVPVVVSCSQWQGTVVKKGDRGMEYLVNRLKLDKKELHL